MSQLEGTTTTTGAIAFPDVPNGSLIGTTVMVSDSLETTPPSAILFDASRLAIADNKVQFSGREALTKPAGNQVVYLAERASKSPSPTA